jgi:hypothetical protein
MCLKYTVERLLKVRFLLYIWHKLRFEVHKFYYLVKKFEWPWPKSPDAIMMWPYTWMKITPRNCGTMLPIFQGGNLNMFYLLWLKSQILKNLFLGWPYDVCCLVTFIFMFLLLVTLVCSHYNIYPSFGLMAWSFGSIEEHIWTLWISLLSMLILILNGWLKLLDCLF